MDREKAQGLAVLFPIRLDDTALKVETRLAGLGPENSPHRRLHRLEES